MNPIYLQGAKEKIPNIPLLINLVSRRVRQLNAGDRPLVKPDARNQPNLDVALKEVAEGKLTAEITFTAEELPDEDSIITL